MTAVDLGKIGVWTSYRPFGLERAGEAPRSSRRMRITTWTSDELDTISDADEVTRASRSTRTRPTAFSSSTTAGSPPT